MITQGEIIDPFLLLKNDLSKIAYASYFAELLRSSCAENRPQPQIFILLLASWSFLEENLPPALVARFFELRLLHYYGYSPRLDQCVFCGRVIPGASFRLVPWRGGVACLSCAEKNEVAGAPLTAGTILMMDKLLHAELSKISMLRPSLQALQEMEVALAEYWQYHMENALESRKIIHELLMGGDV